MAYAYVSPSFAAGRPQKQLPSVWMHTHLPAAPPQKMEPISQPKKMEPASQTVERQHQPMPVVLSQKMKPTSQPQKMEPTSQRAEMRPASSAQKAPERQSQPCISGEHRVVAGSHARRCTSCPCKTCTSHSFCWCSRCTLCNGLCESCGSSSLPLAVAALRLRPPPVSRSRPPSQHQLPQRSSPPRSSVQQQLQQLLRTRRPQPTTSCQCACLHPRLLRRTMTMVKMKPDCSRHRLVRTLQPSVCVSVLVTLASPEWISSPRNSVPLPS